MYHNFEYDKRTRDYTGTVLYKNQKAKEFPSRQERVQFLGNDRNNCTLLISPVNVNDTGKLGLRMTSVDNNKWLEAISLNVSGKAWGTGSSRLGNDRGGKHSTPGTDHKPVSGRGQTGVPAGNGGSTRQGRPASRLPPSSCPFQNLGSRSPDFSREEGNLHFQGKSPDG